MFDRMARGWELLKQSWQVLKLDKELLWFPVFSGIACLLVLASFLLPIIALVSANPDQAAALAEQAEAGDQPWQQYVAYGLMFLFYFASYFVIVFFNVALVSCAIIRFKGGDPTLGDGLRAASARLPQIAAWALVAASVGMILRLLEERFEALGRFVVGLIGMAWSVVTYFVVPILAVEQVGPVTAVKRSTALLRRTWGEALTGNFSLGLINLLLILPGIALIIGGIMLGANLQNQVVQFVGIGLGVIYLLGLSILLSTLQQIFLAGVYLYASEGRVPNGFSEEAVLNAFRHR